jgi:gas vesicle protein
MKAVRFLSGMLMGALVGAALVLFLAPRSGGDTRRLIQERVDAILAEGRRAAEERRLELQTQFEALKQPD